MNNGNSNLEGTDLEESEYPFSFMELFLIN